MYSRESKIMRKLLGKAATDSATGNSSSITGTATPTPSSFRSSKSQDADHSAGYPISCFDVSSDRRVVVLAGSHILKTIIVNDTASRSFEFRDGIDVRKAITKSRSHRSRSNNIDDQLNVRDVKWHNGYHLYTACGSGKVFSYNLTRLGAGEVEPLTYIMMNEDSRQINSLDINPHLQSWLLTGGQDGTARIFDSNSTASARHGVTFRQRFAPLRCTDPIRRVSWSPTHGHEMACSTDSGLIMKWDVRQPSRPVLRINAHEKACSSIAWHPDGCHILSAGWDNKIHVWDFGSTADKRQRAKFTISAPASVAAVAWRPGMWSASSQARRVAQVAVTYDEAGSRKYGTPAVHIWDLARPLMPYKEIESFESCPSAIWWHDQDLLWIAGHDGSFSQRDMAFARKAIDRQSTSAMAFSSRGDTFFLLDERTNSNRLRFNETYGTERMLQRATYGSSPGNTGLSLSRSDSEDEVLGSFLGPRRRATRKRIPSSRGGVPLSTTPPLGGTSFVDDAKQNLDLDQSINLTGMFKPQQAMAFGHLPAAVSVQVYQFMSSAYLEIIQKGLPYVEGGKCMVERVGDILEQFAKVSEAAKLHRLAQTWRILSNAMSILLQRRAQYHFKIRVGQSQQMPADAVVQKSSVDGRPHPVRSLLAAEIVSTSNMPTPVARPADSSDKANTESMANLEISGPEHEESAHAQGETLLPIVEPERLPSPVPTASESFEVAESTRKRLDSEPLSEESSGSTSQSHDFHGAETSAKAIDVPVPRQRNNGRGGGYRDGTADDSLGLMYSTSNGNGTGVSSGRMGSSGDAFARPGLIRKHSDLERESDASSQDSPFAEANSMEPKARSGRPSGEAEKEGLNMFVQALKADDESHLGQPPLAGQGMKENDSSTWLRNAMSGIDGGQFTDPRMKASMSARHDPRPHIVESDYLPWSHDPPYPHLLNPQERGGGGGGGGGGGEEGDGIVSSISCLQPYSLLLRALDFESRTCALHASAIILLLKPLVPDSVIDKHRAQGILRQHHRRLMEMSLFEEATILRNMCFQGWPDGLPGWGESYEGMLVEVQRGCKTGLFCMECDRPREIDPRSRATGVWMCERCRSVMGPCCVCGHRQAERACHVPDEIAPSASDVEFDFGGWLSEWWFCPVCRHGGHASCLHLWHGASAADLLTDASIKYSDGCCPSDGCGHACLPGKYRSETSTTWSEEVGRAAMAVDSYRAAREAHNKPGSRGGSRGGSRRSSPGPAAGFHRDRGVRSDGNEVPQSKAVGMAREALSKNSGGGIISSSPGRTVTGSGDRERRKSVKFARQDHGG